MRLVTQYTDILRCRAGFLLGLFQRALRPLGALMCPLGLPPNKQCALWLRAPQNQHTSIFNSHLNLKTLLGLNKKLCEH